VTDLPAVDEGGVVAFWERFLATGRVPAGTPVPTVVEPFGDSVELADELIALVVDGPKRATAGSVADHERDGVPLPVVGGLSIATDGAGRPRAVLRTTDVRIGPLDSVDDAFAWDEGEGDRTRASWLAGHERYFRRSLAAAGLPFDPTMATVFERFEVVYAE
jgi:uncharacterized protein YhfF